MRRKYGLAWRATLPRNEARGAQMSACRHHVIEKACRRHKRAARGILLRDAPPIAEIAHVLFCSESNSRQRATLITPGIFLDRRQAERRGAAARIAAVNLYLMRPGCATAARIDHYTAALPRITICRLHHRRRLTSCHYLHRVLRGIKT